MQRPTEETAATVDAGHLPHVAEAIEAAELATYEVDFASRTVRLSPRGVELFGLQEQRVYMHDELLALVHPDDRDLPGQALRRALAGEDRGIYHLEYRVVLPDGRLRWLSPRGRIQFAPAPDGERRPVRMVGLIGDVTHRKEELVALQRISHMMHALGEATDAFLYVKDREGRMVYCNNAVLRAIGKTTAEVIGHTDREFLGPGAGTDAIEAHDRGVIESGERSFVEEKLEPIGRTYFSTKAPWRDGDGRIFGLAGVSMDVTDQRRMEQTLRDSEERASIAMEAAEIGFYEWDPVADRIVWSDTMCRLFGVPQGPLSIEMALSRMHPDDRPSVEQAIAEALDPGGEGRFDREYRTNPDGKEVHWLHVIGRVRFAERDGRQVPVRFAGVAIDITARKKMEWALREAGRRKDEFLAMLGHELRNPLAPLRNAAELLRRGELSPAQLAALQQMIARQVAHMARLVDDLLDASRVDQGKIALARTPVELKPLLSATLEGARSFIEPRGHHVELVIPPEPLWVEGDAVRLTQILTNLLHNAAKFTPDRGRIRVALEHGDGMALIRVADNGQGMAPGLLPHVFDLFMQGDATLSREKGGLGIGLSLVRNLALLHGGDVTASSAGPGKGSEFVVRLPLIEAPKRGDDRAPRREAGPSRRVLIVDDNRDAAETLQMLLSFNGHQVETAFNGEDGIDAAERSRPEVMLVDIGLPRMSGYDVARRLGAMPDARPDALIALTGYGSADDRERSLAAGFDHHLVKPVVVDELLEILRKLPSGATRPEGSALAAHTRR